MGVPTTPPSVAVVVLNYNGLDDTLKCLTSLRGVTHPRLSVVLVDNGSSVDPGPEALRCYNGLRVIQTGANLGYAGGNNRGIQAALDAGADYVVILNNDTTVSPEIVTCLLDAFSADSRLGIVGPVINYMDEPAVVMTDGVRFNPGPGTEFFQRLVVPLQPHARVPVSVDIVNGCCMMVKAEVFRRVGLFDERLFIVHEESDLCLRAVSAGFRCGVLGKTLVWHKGSSAFERSGRQLQRYFDTRNLFYLLRRHSGRVASSRRQATSLVHYVRYAFYRYCAEMDDGKRAAANAVAYGLWDAFLGRIGPYEPRHRIGAELLAGLFSVGRRLSLLRHRVGG